MCAIFYFSLVNMQLIYDIYIYVSVYFSYEVIIKKKKIIYLSFFQLV